MNKDYINAILTVTCLSFSAAGMAQSLSENEYRSLKKGMEVDYQTELAHCSAYTGKERKLCVSMATSNSQLALAELDARYINLDITP